MYLDNCQKNPCEAIIGKYFNGNITFIPLFASNKVYLSIFAIVKGYNFTVQKSVCVCNQKIGINCPLITNKINTLKFSIYIPSWVYSGVNYNIY